jgi:hypothetical protein
MENYISSTIMRYSKKVYFMNKKKIKIIVLIITVLILSSFLFVFIILPFMILPAYPVELIYIHNFDDINHTVVVQIFDSENSSIYLKSFNIKADDSITIDRGFDWCPNNRFYWLSWEEGSYTFYVTLDDIYNESCTVDLYPLMTVCIDVYFRKTPLNIKLASV